LSKRIVDIRRVKEFASTLPNDSVLREVLLAQKDVLETSAFLSKIEDWLTLARRECSQSPYLAFQTASFHRGSCEAHSLE
jgi:hypothetical protein